MARKLAPLAENYNIQIDKEIFNEKYLPYLYTLNRYEVYYGGSSSGKSHFIASKLALQLTINPGRNLIILRHQEKDCKDSTYPELYKALDRMKLIDFWQIKESPSVRLINRINGNEIALAGLDDVENVKSITFKKGNLTDIWLEEATEIEKVTDVRELMRRLRGAGPKKRIMISFNPIARTHWIHDYVTKEIQSKDHMVLRTTYKDNKFLNKEDIEELESLQFIDPYAYMVYALGEWGVTGASVFNRNAVYDRLLQLQQREPPTHIEFSFRRDANGLPNRDSFEHFLNIDGETIIYKFPDNTHPYVLAFDTAGEGSDWWAGHVIDNVTGEQVATYHSPKLPHDCILQIYGLGRFYNDALICPEVNMGEYALLKLQELQYPRIYQRVSPGDSYHRSMEQKLGFRTTAENRQRILSELVEWSNKNMIMINDIDTLNEMLTFTRQTRKLKGIFWAAENGARDDLIMSLAIALQAREQQESAIRQPKVEMSGKYLKEELDVLVRSGRITKYDANEYKRKHGMDSKDKSIESIVGRVKRYVRKSR